MLTGKIKKGLSILAGIGFFFLFSFNVRAVFGSCFKLFQYVIGSLLLFFS